MNKGVSHYASMIVQYTTELKPVIQGLILTQPEPQNPLDSIPRSDCCIFLCHGTSGFVQLGTDQRWFSLETICDLMRLAFPRLNWLHLGACSVLKQPTKGFYNGSLEELRRERGGSFDLNILGLFCLRQNEETIR